MTTSTQSGNVLLLEVAKQCESLELLARPPQSNSRFQQRPLKRNS
jgi:hypothetical protein